MTIQQFMQRGLMSGNQEAYKMTQTMMCVPLSNKEKNEFIQREYVDSVQFDRELAEFIALS